MTLLLAAIGIYGVASHLRVAPHTRKSASACRSALARGGPADVRVLDAQRRDYSRLVASGAASQPHTSFLFGLGATDATTFASAVAVIGLVAVMASYLPARRAARVDLLRALRHGLRFCAGLARCAPLPCLTAA
jgi:putative ABC transport system permease protein